MTEMERVWERLKTRAVLNADAGAPRSMANAVSIVTSICDEECRERPPADAIEYFAGELLQLTSNAQAPGLTAREVRS